MRAPAITFTAAARGIRVRVRVLPSVAAVHAESLAAGASGERRTNHALFHPSRDVPVAGGIVGTIVLPVDGALLDLVPHEVTHAVMHDLRAVCHSADEELATRIGLLSAAIFSGLHKRGIEIAPC